MCIIYIISIDSMPQPCLGSTILPLLTSALVLWDASSFLSGLGSRAEAAKDAVFDKKDEASHNTKADVNKGKIVIKSCVCPAPRC
jgi:hypothetical protein